MLEKPDLQDCDLVECLRRDYAIRVTQIAFLPLGADRDSAVYRVVAADAAEPSVRAVYFLKLRHGVFNDERLTAIGGLNRDPFLDASDVGRVRHVYVLSAFRRQGVGTLL